MARDAGDPEETERGPDDPEDDGADSPQPDEGDEGGEPGDSEGEEGEEGEPEEVEVSPRDRIREAADRAAADARRQAELDARQRDLDARESERTRVQQEQAERQEKELLAQMSPEQQAMYTMAKEIKALRDRQSSVETSSFDQTDKAQFAKYEADPRFKKHAAEVERGYQELRRQGTRISRVAVLDYILGKSLRERGEAAQAKQRRQGAARVNASRGSTGQTRSNVSGSPRGGRTVVDRAETEDWQI